MKKAFIFAIILLVILCSFSSASAASLKPGDLIYYGAYEQDMNLENGKEKILWRVLDVDTQSNIALLLSEFALDCVVYNDNTNYAAWGDSYIRNWLQNIFLPSAFNAVDRQFIVPADASGSEDQVFLLSADDLSFYLGKDLLCTPTGLAMNHGVFKMDKTGKLTCSYWIRKDSTTTYGMYVGAMGGMKDNHNKVTMDDNGVRPAIFLSLNYDGDTPGASLANLHLQERVTEPGWATVMITDQVVLDRMGYFEEGHNGSNKNDFDKFYSSGAEAEFVVLRAAITNKSSQAFFVPANTSVTLVFNNDFYYKGWCYQYNHNNGTSTTTYVNEGDYAKQNENYIISHDDEFAIAPGQTGYFCFGCTVPNAIINSNESLQLTIDIDGHEVVYTFR